jgi:hypothetical protein
LAEAVELARRLNRLPDSLQIYGIEGAEFGAGRGFSPMVQISADRVVETLLKRLSGD